MHHRGSFATGSAAKNAAIEFIEVYCNRKGSHPAIGCKVLAKVIEGALARQFKGRGPLRQAEGGAPL